MHEVDFARQLEQSQARSPARPGPNKNSTLTLEDDFLIAGISPNIRRLLVEGRGSAKAGARDRSVRCALAAEPGGVQEERLVPLGAKRALEGDPIVQVSGDFLRGERR